MLRKIVPDPYRSLKIIQNGTIRKLGCSFLFAFHSNYGSILHQFRDKARYWSKIVMFFIPLAFDVSVMGFLSEYCHPVWYGTTRMMGLPDSEENLTIRLLVSTDFTNVTDTHTDTARRHRLR